MPQKKYKPRPIAVEPAGHFPWGLLCAGLLGFFLLIAPLAPDEKLNRLKLIALGAGFLATALAWAVSKASESKWALYRTPIDLFIFLYFCCALLYYFFSGHRAVAQSELERMIFSVGAFAAAVQVCSGERGWVHRRLVFWGWLIGAALSSLYGILQKTGGVGSVQVPQMDRVFSTFGNPIFLAAFLIVTLPWMAAFFFQYRNPVVRVAILASVLLAAAALFLTRTRAAFLALPLSVVPLGLLIDYWRGWFWIRALLQRKRLIAALSVGLAAFHWVLHSVSPAYRQTFAGSVQAVHESRLTSTQETHTVIWKDVFRMWRAHPFFGTGYGTFHIEFPQFASEELKRIFPQRERIVNDAHNEYLQILAETGIVGFAVFMLMLGSFYAYSLRYLRSALTAAPPPFSFPPPPASGGSAPKREIGVYCGVLAGITALLIQNIFSVDMRFIVSSVYLFLGMGLCCSFFSERRDVSWSAGGAGMFQKSAWVGVFALVIGVVGIRPASGSFYALGIYEFKNENGVWRWAWTPAMGPGLFPSLLRPYLSQKVLARTPDFFDEKLLDSAQTIRDLEDLTLRFPDQWRYWEKLGYAYAKEIQSVDAGGKKEIRSLAVQKALASYERAYQLNPSAEGPANNLGNIYFTVNRRADAIAWWRKGIENNPEKIDARLNLGLCYFYEGRIKEAAEQFQEVLKREPNNEKAIVMLKRMVE